MRIHNEYKFVKKRSLMNYLSNSRMNLEKHFHDRTVNMLQNITRFENDNLNNLMNKLSVDAFDEARNEDVEALKKASFESALDGI